MSYKVIEVTAEADFDELVQVEWNSYEKPYCRLIRLFFPIFGSDLKARNAALKESVERQISWNREDPTSQWIKAVDTESGRIVGGAYWHVYQENPYATESNEECTWYPPGEAREMANSLMEQFTLPKMTYMAKPHVFLDICFVHPDYRRKGIGQLLVDHGLRKADEMNLESYIDATEEGIPLYEKCGFIKASGIDFSVEKENLSEQGNRLREELLPFRFWPMWRPAGGELVDKAQIPWNHTF